MADTLSKVVNSFSKSSGEFRSAAARHDSSIARITKDISSVFASNKSGFSNISNSVESLSSSIGQSASRIDTTNSLLQQAIGVSNQILTELKNLGTQLKQSGDGSSSGLLGGGGGGLKSAAAGFGASAAALGLTAGGISALDKGDGGTTSRGGPGGALSQGQILSGLTEDQKVELALKTIKGQESQGNYGATSFAEGRGSTASGGYQFADATWQEQAKKAGVDVSQYQRAKDAPAEIQDTVAKSYVKDILSRNQGDVSAIPREWYAGPKGYLTQRELDVNNGLTVGKYQQDWMQKFSQNAGAAGISGNAALGMGGEGRPEGGNGYQSQGSGSFQGQGGQGGNGNLSSGMLVDIGGNHKLQPAAAQAYNQMVDAAKSEGINWSVTDSYRTYDEQVDLARRKGIYGRGGLAAVPGTSNHGWGLAVDLGGGANQEGSKQNEWLQQNAGRFGFANISGEPWHWEYKGGGAQKPGGSGGSPYGGQEQPDIGMLGAGGMMGMGPTSIPGMMGMGPMGMGGMPGMDPYMALGGALGGAGGAAIGGIAGLALGAIGSILPSGSDSNRRATQTTAIRETASEREALTESQARATIENRSNARQQDQTVQNQFDVSSRPSEYNSDKNPKADWFSDLANAFPELKSAVKFAA